MFAETVLSSGPERVHVFAGVQPMNCKLVQTSQLIFGWGV